LVKIKEDLHHNSF